MDNLRETMGTAPSQAPKKSYKIVRGVEEAEVEMIDGPKNPYKPIVAACCATWGDDKYENKWEKLTPQNRFRVVLAALTGNTLPQALESFMFTFKVNGLTRSCFDQHARARIGSTFFSIGSRDNNKLDSRIILYTKLYDKCFNKDGSINSFGERLSKHFIEMKDIYENVIEDKGSWQIARAVLPMSYNHSYHFSQSFLAMQGQCSRRLMFCEEEFIVALHWLIRERVKERYPLLANYLRPACDNAKKCVYAKSYDLSNAFGCLFAGCGRWPSGTEYATFNESCSDVLEIERQLEIKIPRQGDWLNLTEADYDKLDAKDKKLFEED